MPELTHINYRRAREGAQIGAERAAAALGVSVTTLLKWERGETQPNARHLRDMARLYRASADYLIGLL